MTFKKRMQTFSPNKYFDAMEQYMAMFKDYSEPNRKDNHQNFNSLKTLSTILDLTLAQMIACSPKARKKYRGTAFMGAGAHSYALEVEALLALQEIFSALSGEQQNGGMGYEYDNEAKEDATKTAVKNMNRLLELSGFSDVKVTKKDWTRKK